MSEINSHNGYNENLRDFKYHPSSSRIDYYVITDMVNKGARVLDIGCGDGSLLELLQKQHNIDGRGIELSQEGVNNCVKKGLSVIQGNADTDLNDYPDKAFDYVILSHTIQAMHNPRIVLNEMLRIGKKAIISFPNFGYWRVRMYLMFKGEMPVNKNLPFSWYETPNIHFCTIADFDNLCLDMGVKISKAVALNSRGEKMLLHGFFPANLFGQQAVFLLEK